MGRHRTLDGEQAGVEVSDDQEERLGRIGVEHTPFIIREIATFGRRGGLLRLLTIEFDSVRLGVR